MSARTLLVGAGVALLLGGGCYEDEAVSAPKANGPLARVLLTDAPFPYDSVASVNVHIVRIEANAQPDTSGGGEWEVIATPDSTFDLLKLQQGNTALLGQGELSGDLYRAIRMTINGDRSSVIWNNGSNAVVRWPWPGAGEITLHALVHEPFASWAADGAGAEFEIVLDFDVGRSFLFDYYGPREFTVLPWLRAVHAAFTGTIAGTVTSEYTGQARPIKNANITVYAGDPSRSSSTWGVTATGRTDDQGRYRIAYVGDGTYIVRIEQPEYPFLAPVIRSGVVVTIGHTTTVSVALPEAGSGGAYLHISGPTSVGVGGTIALRAAVADQDGNPIPGPSVAWSSSDTAIAKVTGVGDTGAVQGRQVGRATITAVSDGLSDTLTVEVVGAPQPVASLAVLPARDTLAVNDSTGFRAELRDAGGNVLTNRPVSWFSTDTTVVRIEGAFGEHVVVRARARGTVALRATSEGKVGEASVTVQ